MPAEVAWQVIGLSIPFLAVGGGLVWLALRSKRWWRVPGFMLGLVGLGCLAYGLIMVFIGVSAFTDPTTDIYKCYEPGGVEVECPPDWLEFFGQQ